MGLVESRGKRGAIILVGATRHKRNVMNHVDTLPAKVRICDPLPITDGTGKDVRLTLDSSEPEMGLEFGFVVTFTMFDFVER